MSSVPCLNLGNCLPLDGGGTRAPLLLPAHHLVTHAVITGMTGSGKTGLLMVLVEEALRTGVPVVMIDVKGDLPNLLLNFPTFAASAFLPWMGDAIRPGDPRAPEEVAEQLALDRRNALSSWQIGE